MSKKPKPFDLDRIIQKVDEMYEQKELPSVDFYKGMFAGMEIITKYIKSAVQGLLEEINSSYGCVHHKEIGGDDDCIICVAIGQTLSEIQRKIKKWFPDIIKEAGK